MHYMILLVAVLALPTVLGVVFRVSASSLFFSIMAGELLGRYFGHSAEELLTQHVNSTVGHYGEAIILVLPVVLTAVVMRGTLPKSKVILNFIPWAIAGLVLAVFLLPILPDELQSGLKEVQYGNYFFEINSAIVGVIILSHLIIHWLFNRHEGGHGKKHKK